jgi:hypothetical protein
MFLGLEHLRAAFKSLIGKRRHKQSRGATEYLALEYSDNFFRAYQAFLDGVMIAREAIEAVQEQHPSFR